MTSFEVLTEIVEKASKNAEVLKSLGSTVKTFQFAPSDAEKYYVTMGNEKIELVKGEAPNSTAVISATEAVLTDLFTAKLDPIQAFMTQKMKVSGDIFSAQKLTDIFKKSGL